MEQRAVLGATTSRTSEISRTRRKATQKHQLDPDHCRQAILQFLYDRHKSARSTLKQQIGIRELQSLMKSAHGMTQQDTASNLDYLIQQGFVCELIRTRTFTTPRGTTQAGDKVTYKIAKAGIDRLEGDSEFRRSSPFGGVNITAISSVVALGDGNNQTLVQSQFEALAGQLLELERAISASDLPEVHKVVAIADVETIKTQIAKPQPNHAIVREAWSSVERIVTAGHALELALKIGQLLAPLIADAAALHS